MQARSHPNLLPLILVSGPIIYSIVIPVVLLDIWLELYHRICFPLYGMSYVPRGEYIRIDRQRLPYLSFLEKLNCMYCGYVNGLFGYAVRIAGDTERFFCGIKHQQDGNFHSPGHHKDFAAYGDEQDFERAYPKERREPR